MEGGSWRGSEIGKEGEEGKADDGGGREEAEDE